MIINVLGTGPSLKLYKESDEITIGLNKIILTHKVDFLVIADTERSFPEFFKEKMKEDRFDALYTLTSLADEWRPYAGDRIKTFDVQPIRGRVDLDDDRIPQSVSGGYIGAAMAYYMGATIIDLYGIDYTGHHTFNAKPMNEQHKRSIENRLIEIKEHFLTLQKALIKKGCSLRVCGTGLLSDSLPSIPQSKLNLHAS